MIGIGRLFSTSLAMFRERFWLLLGMVAVFFAIQIAASIGLGIVMMLLSLAGAATLGAGLEDPTAITSMGAGMIVLMVLFYGAYIVLVLAQQAAMVTIASPLVEPRFGAALARGFRSALPFFAIAILLMLAYLALTGVIVGLIAAVGAGGGGAVAVLLALLFLPVIVYLGCRFAVLVPVVAVDEVYNPIAALRRSWAVTRGKVVAIFLALLALAALTLAVLAVPFVLLFSAGLAGETNPGAAVGMGLLGLVVFVPLMLVYSMFAAAYNAALHNEVTGGGAERLEEVFA